MTPEIMRKFLHSECGKAWMDGKTLQYSDGPPGWVDANPSLRDEDMLDIVENSQYCRVKPEPKLRPFTAEEWRERLGMAIFHKSRPSIAVVAGVEEYPDIRVMRYSPDHLHASDLASEFAFYDGSPCGVLE